MSDAAKALADFHEAFGQPFGHGHIEDSELRIRLHREETDELIEALENGDLVATARELADVVIVAYGTAHSLGIPLDAVLAEVHRANMSKMGPDGPLIDAGGKVLKGPNFQPPDVARVIAESPCPCCLGDRDIVCDACDQHSCWAGIWMCEDARTAGTRRVTGVTGGTPSR